MRFSFTISHVPGKNLLIADALSRAPATAPLTGDQLLQQEADIYVKTVVQTLPATEQRILEIKWLQEQDPTCQKVVRYCQSRWPEKHFLEADVLPYYPVATEISIADGLQMRGSRIIIPQSLRQEMLSKIHTGHQGITKCRERARQSVWWPGISTELEKLVRTCPTCCKAQNQRAQPLIPAPLPELPWQKVGTDLFHWKQGTFLLIIDNYSRYIEVAKLDRLSAEEVIKHTKSVFARHGIPEIVMSDNGPQYSSQEYAEFARTYQFKHITSSPHYPQSNGEAERAVGTVKSLLKKNMDPYLALLSYCSTPLQNGYSPSELLMGRILRSTLPTTRMHLNSSD